MRSVLLLALLAMACSDARNPACPTTPPRDLSLGIQTDADCYTLSQDQHWFRAALDYTFTNHSPAPVEIVFYCHDVAAPIFEKLINGTWVRAISPTVPACGGPRTIQPDGTYRDNYSMVAGVPGTSTAPQFSAAVQADGIAGLYRLNWGDVYRTFDSNSFSGERVPLEQRISNTFAVTVGP